MKYPILAIATLSLALAAPAMAETAGPAMKAENAMKMESHDRMAGSMAMSGEKKNAMKPMAMKQADKKPMDTMSMKAGSMKTDPMKTDKDMKH